MKGTDKDQCYTYLCCHFVLKRADLMVFRLFFRLALAQAHFQILNLLLQRVQLRLKLLLCALQISIAVFLVSQSIVQILKFELNWIADHSQLTDNSRSNSFFWDCNLPKRSSASERLALVVSKLEKSWFFSSRSLTPWSSASLRNCCSFASASSNSWIFPAIFSSSSASFPAFNIGLTRP